MALDPISGAVEAGGGLIGSLVGLFTAGADRANAAAAMQRAADAYNIPLPVLQQMVAEQLPPSQQASVYSDPGLQSAQSGALGELQNISDSGGMTLGDRVNNEGLQRDAAQRAQQQRQSIVNTLSRQGVQPGGVSAAMQLGAARDQQEAGALAGAKTAGDARRRATEAVLQRGQLAGQMRTQGFGEANSRAQAADQVAQYNAKAKERTQQYNLGLPQQQYNNSMQRAQGIASTNGAQANFNTQNANRNQAYWSDMGAGAGAAGAGAIQSARNPTPSTQVDYGGYNYAPEKLDENGNPV